MVLPKSLSDNLGVRPASGTNTSSAGECWEKNGSTESNSISTLRLSLENQRRPYFAQNCVRRMKFKQEHSAEERKAESDRVRSKYPDRIPGQSYS
ncbi:hypothetical protein EON65_07370 [archaeon]|nr:MAG: hypothetical protein EON65_07370 [archaeon]